jgi:hypothetical protein
VTLDVDEAKVERNEWGLWLSWTLATALGMIAGLLPFLLLAPILDLGIARVLIPIVAGFLVGLFQWLALRRYLTHCADWIIHGGAAWSLAYALGLLVIQLLSATLIGALISYLIFGVIVATIQWPVLRREIRNALPWVLTNVVGWALGAYVSQWVLNVIVTGEVTSQALSTSVISGLTGLVAGALTGAALVWTVRKPDMWEDERVPA